MISTPSFESVAALTRGNIPLHGFPEASKYADMEYAMASSANPGAAISMAVNNGGVAGVAFNGSIADLISNMTLAAEQVELIRAHAAQMQRETRKEERALAAEAKAKPAAKSKSGKAAKANPAEAIQDHVQELSLFERACARNNGKAKSGGSAEAEATGDGLLASIMEAFKGGSEDIAKRMSGAVASMKDIGISLVPEHAVTPAAEVAAAKSEVAISMFGDSGVHFSNGFLASPPMIPFAAPSQGLARAA